MFGVSFEVSHDLVTIFNDPYDAIAEFNNDIYSLIRAEGEKDLKIRLLVFPVVFVDAVYTICASPIMAISHFFLMLNELYLSLKNPRRLKKAIFWLNSSAQWVATLPIQIVLLPIICCYQVVHGMVDPKTMRGIMSFIPRTTPSATL